MGNLFGDPPIFLELDTLETVGDASFPLTWPLIILSTRLASSWVLLQATIMDEISELIWIFLALGWGTLMSIYAKDLTSQMVDVISRRYDAK